MATGESAAARTAVVVVPVAPVKEALSNTNPFAEADEAPEEDIAPADLQIDEVPNRVTRRGRDHCVSRNKSCC